MEKYKFAKKQSETEIQKKIANLKNEIYKINWFQQKKVQSGLKPQTTAKFN